MNYIEFHSHILFDIDHGVQTLKDFEDNIKAYQEAGFTTVVVTPHIYHPLVQTKISNIRGNFQKASEIAQSYNITLILGSELYLESQTSILTLAAKDKYSLVEFSPTDKPFALDKRLQMIKDFHYTPVIAHVERYSWLKPDSQDVRMMKDMGCLFQANVRGIENNFLSPYLEQNLIDIIASDNHGDITLPDRLRKALDANPAILKKMQSLSL